MFGINNYNYILYNSLLGIISGILLICSVLAIYKFVITQRFENPYNPEMLNWIKNNKKRQYLLNELKQDKTQVYPWMANNPDGSTTYNKRLMNSTQSRPAMEKREQTYYDFGEITYIGNPL